MSLPSVHAIILNWNGLADTLECLASLRRQDYPSLKVHVVDNGSAEDQAGAISRAFPEVDVIKEPTNLGFCGGNNVGIRRALDEGADYVLILNNDTIAPPNLISTLIRESEALNDVGAVSPLIVYHPDHQKVWYAGSFWEGETAGFRHVLAGESISNLREQEAAKTEYACGCCLLVRASVLSRIGLMDERYFAYYDEADWCSRMKGAGLACYVVPRAHLYHKVSGSTPNAVVTYLSARNRLLWMKDHLTGAERRRSLGYLLKETLWNSLNLIGLSIGDNRLTRTQSKAMLRGVCDFVLGRFGKWPDAIQRLSIAEKPRQVSRQSQGL